MNLLIIYLICVAMGLISDLIKSKSKSKKNEYIRWPNDYKLWTRETTEPSKDDLISKIRCLEQANIGTYSDIYDMMFEYNEGLERFYSGPIYNDEERMIELKNFSWEYYIYFLRYLSLEDIKNKCKNGSIKPKYVTYKTISNSNQYDLSAPKHYLRKEVSDLDDDNQWHQYSNWHDRHKAYLKTNAWQTKRKGALERANYKCQLCSSKERLHVHHNTYDRLGNESDSDLIVLCEKCHSHYHGY